MMEDYLFRKKLLPRSMGSDNQSHAETYISLQHDGFCVVNVKPPKSIAEYQMKLNGYEPLKFFDSVNASKEIPHVSKPANHGSYIIKGQLEIVIREEFLKLKCKDSIEPDNPNIHSFEP